MPQPFATADELEASWRPLSDAERARAEALLGRASRKVRLRWPDVDHRLDAQTLDRESVADVVLEMVQSAMTSPAVGVTQASETVGPFSQSQTFDNPAGRLYFTADQIAVFDGYGRKRRAFLIDLTPGA